MSTSDHQDILNLYSESVESYAALMDSEIQSPVYSDTLGRLSQRISALSGPVIDSSCGTGHMLALYNQSYDEDRQLIGIDLVPGMVEAARPDWVRWPRSGRVT